MCSEEGFTEDDRRTLTAAQNHVFVFAVAGPAVKNTCSGGTERTFGY